MFSLKAIPIANNDKAGIFKIDGESCLIENGVLITSEQYFNKNYNQSTISDTRLEEIVDDYYNGNYSLEDIKSFQSVGDIRQANDTDRVKMQIGNVGYMSGAYGSIPAQTDISQVIIDFDHDILKETINNITKALVTVQSLNTLPTQNTTIKMKSTTSNAGGQENSLPRQGMNSSFYNACGFKDLIKTVIKPTGNTQNSSTITQMEDNIFLLSRKEICGTSDSYQLKDEGEQYIYFTIYPMRKTPYSSQWTRSVSTSYSYHFFYVNSSQLSSYTSNTYYGFAPAQAL